MWKTMLSRGLLFLYQMPKTGSQTVEATLRQIPLPCELFRFHFLSPEITQTLRDALHSERATESWKKDIREQLKLARDISRTIRIRRLLALFQAHLPKIHVISGVRDPIGLGLSAVFENHAYLFPSLGSATLDACREELLRPKALTYIQDWFDLEIKKCLGIDVYQSPFPCQKGYAIYENRFARLLVYRSDFLPQLPRMLTEFLGCQIPKVINRNVGTTKVYATTYGEAKARLRLPRDFVASQYNRKLMRHFFSGEERRRLLLRWSDDLGQNASLPLVA